jgi:Homing endonuclease associated repeat
MSKKSRKGPKANNHDTTKPQAQKFPPSKMQIQPSSAAAMDEQMVRMESDFRGKLADREMGRRAILEAITESAARLGHAPSLTELAKLTVYTKRKIRKYFGSYAAALRECKLARGGGGWKVPMETLFRDWAMVVRALKKVPTTSEYAQLSEYSDGPLKTRFGGWLKVPQGIKKYVEDEGWTDEWKDVLTIIESTKPAPASRLIEMPGKGTTLREAGSGGLDSGIKYGKVLPDRPLYGALMRPYPFIHAPTNEDGVLVLFGALAERLGFMIERVQKECPDCEAMRLVGAGKCQRVRIEFEYESRNFMAHMHEASKCDIIVCWVNNWPDCPLEVIELSKVVVMLG